MRLSPRQDAWPELSYGSWRESLETVHMWTQIVGKVKLMLAPWINHSWHVTFFVTPVGLTSGPIPSGAPARAERSFDVSFDFVDHRLAIACDDGARSGFGLEPMSVAAFHDRFFAALDAIGIDVAIREKPSEVADAIPFPQDVAHRSYDPEAVGRFQRALVQSDRVLRAFRSGFIGKCSPVHFFWGAFDLAVTRFSGRLAPEHPGGVPNLPDRIVREAYSHEVSSAGFWPGGAILPEPVYYSYAYPEPEGFATWPVPRGAYYHRDLREFVLPYEVVRAAPNPDEALLDFLRSTYDAAADLAGWDRAALERS